MAQINNFNINEKSKINKRQEKKEKKKSRLGKRYAFSLSVLFVFYLMFFFIINTISAPKDFSETENRVLQAKPSFSVEKLFEGRFTKKYEKYKVDQFFARDFWIDVKVKADRLLAKKESNGVYLAEDGYLLESFDKPNKQNVDENLKAINSFTKKYSNLKHYMLISPTAVNILSSKLPMAAPEIDQNKYIADYKKGLDSNIEFVDTSGILNEHKNEELFYKSDHHWTTLGAFYSYQKLAQDMGIIEKSSSDYNIELVSNSFEGALSSESGYKVKQKDKINVYVPVDKNDQVVVNLEEEQKKTPSLYDSSKLEQKDKYQVFLGGNHPLVKIDTTANSDRTLLIFKDSYANCFVQFLTSHFTRIILVDPRYYYGDIDELIKTQGVDDVLYLYNANTFFSDTSLSPVLNNE